MSIQQSLLIDIIALAIWIILWGCALSLGLTQISKRVSDTHPLNIQAGFGTVIFGLGYLGLWSSLWPDIEIRPIIKLSVLSISVILIMLGGRKIRSALREISNLHDQ
jgi:hypothetical protein